ncbi:MAG: ABC transporter ATP-binding protein [Pyrinomonadaceae bacterium]|nr:ABC transporter ATP-binding protein [Pyrinomonadaceae bacterium]MBP6211911.1 ABC transporter ATP-binding protein [Pyrinomonadaceae bacterium]
MSSSSSTQITGERSKAELPIVIETRGLKKTYFGKIDVPVLFGLDIEIRAREFVAIVGQSGSGKSTLLNILGALDVPTGGTVLVNGVDISTLDQDGLARLRSDEVGFIFQAHYLLDEFTCLENALMPIAIRKGEASDEERDMVLGLLKRVGLGDQTNKHPDEMSGGQNQRCAIVRALANSPKIVLADEPTGNLDSQSGAEVFEMMREMNRESGVAFVMITHDDRLAQAADRILLIQDGNIAEISKEDHRKKMSILAENAKSEDSVKRM